MSVLLDSTKLKPLSAMDTNIPHLEMPKKYNLILENALSYGSIKSILSLKTIPIKNYEDKLAKFEKIEYINKKQIIEYFDMGYFYFMFWTCIHTKTLGTFLVVYSVDSKIYFISMRQKLNGNNFQYNNDKKCIYTNDCKKSKLNIIDNLIYHEFDDSTYYDFPEEMIMLSPNSPYEIKNILSKI